MWVHEDQSEILSLTAPVHLVASEELSNVKTVLIAFSDILLISPKYAYFGLHLFFFFILTFFLKKYLFIWLCEHLCCSTWDLSFHLEGSSLVMVQGLSCHKALGMLVPRPEIEPMSPALEAGVLTAGPPGKSLHLGFLYSIIG